MGTLSDGLLGFGLGAGRELQRGFALRDEENRDIREENRAETRAVNAEKRRLVAEKEKLRYADKLGAKRRTANNAEDLADFQGGRSVSELRSISDQDRKNAQADATATTANQRKVTAATTLHERGQQDASIDAGIAIRQHEAEGVITNQQTLDLQEEQKSRGLPIKGGSQISGNLELKGMTAASIKDTLNSAMTDGLGVPYSSKYFERLKSNGVPGFHQTFTLGTETQKRAAMDSVLNGLKNGKGDYFDENVSEMVKTEVAFSLLGTTSRLAKTIPQRPKTDPMTQLTPDDIYNAGVSVVAKAEEARNFMVDTWESAASPGFLANAAKALGVSEKEARKQFVEQQRVKLLQMLDTTEKESKHGPKSTAFKHIWNIYTKPFDLILSDEYNLGDDQ